MRGGFRKEQDQPYAASHRHIAHKPRLTAINVGAEAAFVGIPSSS